MAPGHRLTVRSIFQHYFSTPVFRTLTSIASFFVILGLYFLYGWVAVPTLLPEIDETEILLPPPPPNEELAQYRHLFEEGSWECDPNASIQILAVGKTVILFIEDEIVGNVAKLKPCTLLFISDDPELSEEERLRQAVILRAPQYAEIEFDGELNFSRFPLPKMKGGKLVGPVFVRSDMKESGPQDDLYLETENVAFSESPALTSINTVKDVRFRLGNNTGEGSMLRLEMALSDPKNPKSSKALSRVQFEKLKRLNLHFFETKTEPSRPPESVPADVASKKSSPAVIADGTNRKPASPGTVPPLPNTEPLQPIVSRKKEEIASGKTDEAVTGKNHYSIPTGPATTVDIRCQREFCFEADKEDPNSWIASFRGDVEAVRTNPDGTQDFLNGEELLIRFQPKKEVAASQSPAPQKGAASKKVVAKPEEKPKNDSSVEGTLGKLEPVQFLALGRPAKGAQRPVPARLRSMQNGGVIMEGDRILYDLQINQVALETFASRDASKEVQIFLQDRYHIVGEKGFLYVMGKEGEFGTLTSEGKGNLKGTVGETQETKKIHLSWNKLLIEPDKLDKTQLLVQLDGGIFVELEDLGTMTAQKLKLWCSTGHAAKPRAEAPSGATSSNRGIATGNVSNPFGENGSLVPERAVVMDNVHFENAGGTCDVKRLDIFFETVSTANRVTQSRWTPRIMTREAPKCIGMDSPVIRFAFTPPGTVPGTTPGRDTRIVQAQHVQPGAPPKAVPEMPSPPIASAPFAPKTRNATAPSSMLQGSAPPSPPPAAYSQNLIGLKGGNSRSVYSISGEMMKMIVGRGEEQTLIRQIWIGGNVRIIEQIPGVTQGDLVEIVGEEIQVWNPSLPDTVIHITGKPPRDAVFTGKGVRMNAMGIKIFRAENMAWVEGPGRLLADSGKHAGAIPSPHSNGSSPLVPLAGATGNEDTRLLVEWNEGMEFNGETLTFLGTPDIAGGRVKAYYQHQKVFCDVMMIHMNRFVSLFDDQSDDPIEAEMIDCAKRTEEVYVENKQYEGEGTLKSFDRAEFDAVRIYLKSSQFLAKGPGILRSTFLKSEKGISRSKGSPLGGKALGPGGDGELAFLCVWFHDQIQGHFLGNRKRAEIRGRVRTIYCPVSGWDERIEINRLNAATKRGYLLECDRLDIAQMPDPADSRKSAMELTASENATIEGEGDAFFGKAQTIKYNQAKSLVIFEGNARIIRDQKEDMPAQRIQYNIDTGAIETSHAQGFQSLGR